MSFLTYSKIKDGYSLLFVGPNGCGKTALYRIIAKLWPLSGGQLTTPEAKHMVFLPQKAYLPSGNLRE
jgi:ABC-type uncharacterized transport system fused permease/ATPase subunit